MSNLGIKINLSKIKGQFLLNVPGKTTTKRCLCIPLDTPGIYEGEKNIYLDMIAFEYREPKYTDTHMVKISIPKEILDAMTEDEKNNQPIIGGLRPVAAAAHKPIEITNTYTGTGEDGGGDDLPF